MLKIYNSLSFSFMHHDKIIMQLKYLIVIDVKDFTVLSILITYFLHLKKKNLKKVIEYKVLR